MSGFRKCCEYRQGHLLCDLPRVLIDSIVVELVLPENFVLSIGDFVLSIGDFVLEGLCCAQRLWILLCSGKFFSHFLANSVRYIYRQIHLD